MELKFIDDTIQFGRSVINYQYAFSNRKHLSLSVYPDLRIIAIAPKSTNLVKIREKIKKRGSWILKQIQFFKQFLPVAQPRLFVSGESHLYLGKQYRLKIQKGNKDQVKLIAGYFQVTVNDQKTSEKVRFLMEQWYLSHAKTTYSKLIEMSLSSFTKHDIKKPFFKIRHLKSKWGICSKSGILTLNTELIKTPKSCIQYVITHELCHIIEPNHSPKFYALLDQTIPEWSKLKEQLNLFGNIVY